MFSSAGLSTILGGFTVTQVNGSARHGVFGAMPGIMRGNAFVQIVCDTRVKTAIAAFYDVDMPCHKYGRLSFAIGLA